MIILPETPLIELPFHKARLFIKCENTLPFGGGNKIRRLLCWLDENKQAEEIHLASDYGAHSFLVLSNILCHENYRHLVATFWERKNSTFITYREHIRKKYLNNKSIVLKNFNHTFYGKYILTSLRNNKKILFSLGGKVPIRNNSYAKAISECISQLRQKGITNSRVWHLLPLASGMMADELFQYLHASAHTNHTIIGLLTGEHALRPILKMKYYYSKIHAINTHIMPHKQYDSLADSFYKLSNIILDPLHTIYLWEYLEKKSPLMKKNDIVVMWLTHPQLEGI